MAIATGGNDYTSLANSIDAGGMAAEMFGMMCSLIGLYIALKVAVLIWKMMTDEGTTIMRRDSNGKPTAWSGPTPRELERPPVSIVGIPSQPTVIPIATTTTKETIRTIETTRTEFKTVQPEFPKRDLKKLEWSEMTPEEQEESTKRMRKARNARIRRQEAKEAAAKQLEHDERPDYLRLLEPITEHNTIN